MQTVIKVALIYIFILIGMRIMGKREFGQLAPMELVSLLLIPELVSQAVIGEDFSMTNAIIALTTLFAIVFLSSSLAHLSKKAEDVIEGVPTVLVHEGKLLTENMNKERVTPEEIFAEMHKTGLVRLEEVEWAILAEDGKIAIVPVEHSKPSAVHKPDELVTL
jgi:uncharacterized membrane protein YcaP (DUF421 family)